MLRDGYFASQQDAALELFAFIDGYYNTSRLHSSSTRSPPLSSSQKSLSLTKSHPPVQKGLVSQLRSSIFPHRRA